MSRSGTLVTGRAAQGSRLALLAILAAARGRSVTRDKIVGLLWPESPSDRARRQLSDAIYILRAALGDDVILAIGDDLTLNAELVSSDLVEFENLIETDQLQRAVELRAGPLLDGFHLGDSVEFERWLDSERLRLDQLYTRALETLAGRSERSGDFAAAVVWWRRLAVHEPHSGRIALGLMRALEATGDRAAAIRHARVHTELLQQEFDAQPDSEVVAFAERLRVTPPVVPPLPQAARVVSGTDIPVADVAEAHVRPRKKMYAALLAAAVVVTVAIGAVYGLTARRPPAEKAAHSVAVLPFVNMSDQGGTDYFSDGLSEQIISVLARIPGLRVAARTSSFALRDAKLDIRTIADTLNVTTVLEGSVRRDGNRLRVTAQLIDAATGYHLWSGDYDREMRQIVAVQDEIAGDIARALQLRLPAAPSRRDREVPPHPEAYDFYLRALYLRDTFTADALSQAVRYLDRAVELDPQFARAYMLKATVLGPAIYWGHIPVDKGVADTRVAITRALALDPEMGEAFGALGMLKLFFDWDLPAAERALRHALELNPNDHHAWHMLGNYYAAMGSPRDEVAARTRASVIDPLNVRMGLMLATAYNRAGMRDESLAQFERITKLAPAHPMLLGLGPDLPVGPVIVYLKEGRDRDVVEEFLRVASMRGADERELARLRTASGSGMPTFWRAWLAFDAEHTASPDPLRSAMFRALAGDDAQALDLLERAYAERNPALVYVFTNAVFASLREHPRFRRLSRQMNFPLS